MNLFVFILVNKRKMCLVISWCFKIELFELFKWISQLCHFQKLNCDIHMLKVKWVSLRYYHFAHLTVIAIAFLWKMSSAFEIESVKSLWYEWLETRTNEERMWKKNKKIDFENPPLFFGAELFFEKKNQDNSRQQTSFLISYTPPQCLARGKRWLRKCCWRLLLEITNWLNLIKWFV